MLARMRQSTQFDCQIVPTTSVSSLVAQRPMTACDVLVCRRSGSPDAHGGDLCRAALFFRSAFSISHIILLSPRCFWERKCLPIALLIRRTRRGSDNSNPLALRSRRRAPLGRRDPGPAVKLSLMLPAGRGKVIRARIRVSRPGFSHTGRKLQSPQTRAALSVRPSTHSFKLHFSRI